MKRFTHLHERLRIVIVMLMSLIMLIMVSPAMATSCLAGYISNGICIMTQISNPSTNTYNIQTNINNFSVVQLNQGTWQITSPINLWAGKTLQGVLSSPNNLPSSANWITELKAAAGWTGDEYAGVVVRVPSGQANDVSYVKNLNINANVLSTYGVVGGYVSVVHNLIHYAKCNGVGISGANTTVYGNRIENNAGIDPYHTPTSWCHPAAENSGSGIYVERHAVSPIIGGTQAYQKNIIRYNIGPALDVDGVQNPSNNRAKFVGNEVYDNARWAALSLFDTSYWDITNNYIHQGYIFDTTWVPYHPSCVAKAVNVGGWSNSSGIIMCMELGKHTNEIKIADNTITALYGILTMGENTPSYDWSPNYLIILPSNTFVPNPGAQYCLIDDSDYPTNPGSRLYTPAQVPQNYQGCTIQYLPAGWFEYP